MLHDPDGTRYFTIGEVARMARVSKMTVYRQVRAGKLESQRVEGAHRIPEDAVRRWLGGMFTPDGEAEI